MDVRELRPLGIAARCRIAFENGAWRVPSQGGHGGTYRVTLNPVSGPLCPARSRPARRRLHGRPVVMSDECQVTCDEQIALSSLPTRHSSAPLFAHGIHTIILRRLVQDGLAEVEARSRFWMVDRGGTLHAGRADLTPEQRVYAQPADRVDGWART
jgi:hypothetical protein